MSGGLPDELPPDFQFGAYVIRGCIGRGGMARIYRAEHATLRRSVALKVLDRWLLEQPMGRERFLREARAAAAIKHPHVVDILDVGVWCDRPFIVMELLTGCDLATYLEDCGTLSNREIASLALPVIAGVMAVHDAGVVHRDLKPSNIFLSKEPEGLIVPKVLDFGVSKVSGTLIDSRPGDTQSRDIVGTPAYMAPEGLEGVGKLGPAGDQYAIGAVLYECAVGGPPFEGETLLGLLKALAVGDIERPSVRRPDILPEIERVILRAIERDPNDRFPSLRDMGRELWPFADERTKTVWAYCFGKDGASGPGSGDAATTWMGLRPPREDKSRRKASWREDWRALEGVLARPWVVWLAVASALALLAGGLLLEWDSPTPVASAVAGAPAAALDSREPSTPSAPPEASASAAASSGNVASAETHAEKAHDETTPSDRLATVTAALHRQSAERDPRRMQGGPRGAVRRRTARKAPSREEGDSRAITAASSPMKESATREGLEDPFVQVRSDARPATTASAESELDGLFPGLTRKVEHGANRAPIPD